MNKNLDFEKYSLSELITNFDNTIRWNIEWYKNRSRINKYIHHILSFLLLFIHSLLLFFDSINEYSDYVQITLLCSIVISGVNLTINPFVSW